MTVDRAGRHGNSYSSQAAISPDGNLVAFATSASGLVQPDPTPFSHVYVRDLRARTTVLASVTSAGTAIAQSTGSPVMSNVGVAFTSFYADVVAGGNAGMEQAYFRSR